MSADAGLEFIELGCEGFLRAQPLAQADKCAHDMHTHFYGRFAVEDISRLDRSVFDKSVGKEAWIAVTLGTGRILRPVCCLQFFTCQLKNKILGKASGVAFHLFV